MRYERQDKHMGGTEHGTEIKSHMQSEVLITIEEKRLSGHRLYPFFYLMISTLVSKIDSH